MLEIYTTSPLFVGTMTGDICTWKIVFVGILAGDGYTWHSWPYGRRGVDVVMYKQFMLS